MPPVLSLSWRYVSLMIARSARNFSFAVLALIAFSFLFSRNVTGQCGTTAPTGSINWTTAWCDEFNGAANSTIDPRNWTYDTGAGGWGNEELEVYCAPSSKKPPCNPDSPNAYIDGDGHLAIQVRLVGSTYTSARLKTQGLHSFYSGRMEASIKMPSHAGLWPAFWMLGAEPHVHWPLVGESDIMENWPATSKNSGPGATGNCSTIHTKITTNKGKGECAVLSDARRIDDGFHIYGQIWSANMLQFYIDDPTHPFFVVTASDLPPGDVWPFSSSADPFFLIANIAVGGMLGSPTDSLTAKQPPMMLDYVRHYEPSTVPAPKMTPAAGITVKAGATTGNTTSIDILGTTGSGRVAFSCNTTAPKASCIVTSDDSLNNHTVDFGDSNTATATVTVTTAANLQRAGRPKGTAPGNYNVTVNAFTVSSSDAKKPSASTTVNLIVN
jgi:beta-glucanase (GH16 family)